MDPGCKVSCVLCHRSEETKMTGALSTKDEVTAHQNCLLFSSGLYCRGSPLFDDLFGFSIEDVMDEVKRGSKLNCNKCKRRGATAGCEVKRCKKSYHYPCAVQEGAKTIEDPDKGNYGLYCSTHYEQLQRSNSNGSVGGPVSSSTGAKPSKEVSCLACERTEGKVSLRSLSDEIVMLYCDKHAPSSNKRNVNGDSAAADGSVFSRDSNSSSSLLDLHPKRRLTSSYKQEENPCKCKIRRQTRQISDSSNSGSNEANPEMEIFAPLESDLDDSENSVPEDQLVRKDTESPTESTTASSPEQNPDRHTAGPSIPQQSLTGPPPFLDHSEPHHTAGSAPRSNSAISPAQPDTICESHISSSPLSKTPTIVPKPSIDSHGFWRSCNLAGCTQAIFTDFISEMNNISRRIQSDEASQEDYDLALTVMSASGKLSEYVTKLQEELRQKQLALTKAAEAMKEVVVALSR